MGHRSRVLAGDPEPVPRVCLVVGSSSGIGRAVALELAGRGDALVLAARRADALTEVADECDRHGAAGVAVVPTDVAVDAEVRDLVASVLERHGRLDVVVHCAGVVTYGPFTEVPAADFDRVVRINLLGAAAVARHALPPMRERGSGTLLLVGSLLGHVTVPEMTPYVVSKWGVRALARQLKVENADCPGVRIAYVAPGSVDTPIYERALDHAGSPATPPPPTMSPVRAARRVVAHLDARRLARQTAATNRLLIAVHVLAPAAYDRVVGPAFRLLSRR